MRDPHKPTSTHAGSNSPKSGLAVALAIALVMLGAAVGTGLIIRHIRSVPPAVDEPSPVSESAQQAEVRTPDPLPAVPERVVRDEPQAPVVEVPQEVPEPEPEPEPQPVPPQMARGFPGRPQGWGNLNLTEEEQARLREGLTAMFQRFQSMSEEERQAQMARFDAMRQRFEGMSDQERQQAMGRVQQQIEQWRQNGGSADDLMNSLSLD